MKRIALVIAALLLAAPWAYSATQAGTDEILVQGSLQNSSADQADNFITSGQITYNKFILDNVSLGASLRVDRQEIKMKNVASQAEQAVDLPPEVQDILNNQTETQNVPQMDTKQVVMTIFLSGRADYYFNTGGIYVPYVGAHLGVVRQELMDNKSTEFSYGAQAGVKFFVSENISWNAEVDYSQYKSDEDTTKTTSLLAGLSYYF